MSLNRTPHQTAEAISCPRFGNISASAVSNGMKAARTGVGASNSALASEMLR